MMVASTMIPAAGPVDMFFTGTPPRAMNASTHQYAGQQLTTGAQAEVYAHPANGQTPLPASAPANQA
jgi:hypothetical protein